MSKREGRIVPFIRKSRDYGINIERLYRNDIKYIWDQKDVDKVNLATDESMSDSEESKHLSQIPEIGRDLKGLVELLSLHHDKVTGSQSTVIDRLDNLSKDNGEMRTIIEEFQDSYRKYSPRERLKGYGVLLLLMFTSSIVFDLIFNIQIINYPWSIMGSLVSIILIAFSRFLD